MSGEKTTYRNRRIRRFKNFIENTTCTYFGRHLGILSADTRKTDF